MAWKIAQFEEMKHPRGAHGTFTFKSENTKTSKGKKRKGFKKLGGHVAPPAKKRLSAMKPIK